MRILLLLAVVVTIGCSEANEEQPFPKRAAPSFAGVDQAGNQFNSKQLAGRPWLASFFFTSCQTVCPILNAEQQQLVQRYGARMRFVSISTDPNQDTGTVLREYAAQYGANPGEWWMIRMPLEDARKVSTTGFGLMDPQEPAMHSTRFVAVDKEGQICGYFDSTDSTDMHRLRSWINSQQ